MAQLLTDRLQAAPLRNAKHRTQFVQISPGCKIDVNANRLLLLRLAVL